MVLFFWGGTFTDGFMCWTTLQTGFDVFSEKWKTPDFFQGILLNGFIFFGGIWPGIGACFTKWFWYFSKNNEYIYKMVCSFFGENATSLIQKWLSFTECFIKFLEIWSYFYKMVCKIIAKQWFWIVLAPPTRPPKFQGGSDAQNTKLDLSTGAK